MKKFKVAGMSCASCANSLEAILKNLDSTKQVSVNYASHIAYLDSSDYEAAKNAASEIGYTLQDIDENEMVLKIGGMSCASCSASIEHVLSKNENVSEVSVSLTTKQAYIKYTNNKEAIINQIKDLGYSVEAEIKEKNELPKLIFISILGIILFVISMFPMFHIPIFKLIDPHHNLINNVVLQIILTSIIMYLCLDIMVSGYKKLVKKIPNMDSLIFIGVTASFLYSTYLFISVLIEMPKSHPMMYFESAGMILVFVKIGKYIEEKSKSKSYQALHALLKMTPQFVTLKDESTKNINDVLIGDIIVVKPGNRLSLDGKITFGSSFIDEVFLTGESIPSEKTVGDLVYAGTINQNGYFEYEVTKANKNSVLTQIVEMVEQAQNSKAPIAKLVDIISGYFVWGIISIAIVSFLIWTLIGKDFAFTTNIVISILVIACPCALGLATPIAILVGSTKGSQLNILFKKASSLQALSEIDTVIFDKTGTITSGKPQLVFQKYYSDESIFSKVASIEKASEHPLGKAIVDFAVESNIDFETVESFEVKTSKGISGIIDGKTYHIGNIRLMQENNVAIFDQDLINTRLEQGESLIYIAKGSTLVGLMGIKDELKPGIERVITYLNKHNITPYIVSGDQEKVVSKVAQSLNIKHYHAEVLPNDKHEIVEVLQNKGHKVAMIGDGINDSIALSSAHVGIAIGNGSEIAIESADVILMHSQILDLAIAIDLAKKTMRNVYENLFWAFIYNTVGIVLASGLLIPFGIALHPMFAAFAMSFSSISVVLNALRLLNYKFKD